MSDPFAREMWDAKMKAAGYLNQKETTPMTAHTRTEESEFGETVEHGQLIVAVQKAREGMKKRAEREVYPYMVRETFRIGVTMIESASGGEQYSATASATFARIVPAEPAFDGEVAPGLIYEVPKVDQPSWPTTPIDDL